MHARDVTYATFCQGPYPESARYREFMGWTMPWYAAPRSSLDTLLSGREVGMMHLISYLPQGSRVFETYWTWMRGVEAMDNSYRLLDLTVYGRQEDLEDSPAGWPHRRAGKQRMRTDGRPTSQWSRLKARHSDDLGNSRPQRAGIAARHEAMGRRVLDQCAREVDANCNSGHTRT